MSDHPTVDRSELAARITALEFAPSATYPEPPQGKDFWGLDIVQATVFATTTGMPVRMLGDPGTGKTSFGLWVGNALGLKTVYLPAALLTPEDMTTPMPTDRDGRRVLDFLVDADLMDPAPKLLVIDELNRAESVTVQNQLLELVQHHRIADVTIPNLVGILAFDNEGRENGITTEADFTLADRFTSLKIGPNQVPWRLFLALKYREHDLNRVYAVYSRLTPRQQWHLSPRVLDHVIECALAGLPAVWGLPIQPGRFDDGDGSYRRRIRDADGRDRTDEILADICAALGVPNRDRVPDAFDRALQYAFEHGANLFVEGPPGIAKTSVIEARGREAGFDVKVLSVPVLSPENLVVPFPDASGQRLERMILEWFTRPGRKLLVLDEVWRGSPAVANKLMELTQLHSLAGRAIDDLVIVAINNPPRLGSYKLNVGRADQAQVERFALNLEVGGADLPAKSWLLRTYGEIAEPFVEWHTEDLSDEARPLITMRALERMIQLYAQNLPLEWAKPFLNGEHVPVSLHDLEARLAKQPMARLRKIAAEVDDYEAALSAKDADTTQVATEVFYAFMQAELVQLEDHRDAIVRLIGWLPNQNIINLMRRGGSFQKFWNEVFRQAVEYRKLREAGVTDVAQALADSRDAARAV